MGSVRTSHAQNHSRVSIIEPREARDAKMVALPGASAFTRAAAPRGEDGSCLNKASTPGYVTSCGSAASGTPVSLKDQ